MHVYRIQWKLHPTWDYTDLPDRQLLLCVSEEACERALREIFPNVEIKVKGSKWTMQWTPTREVTGRFAPVEIYK